MGGAAGGVALFGEAGDVELKSNGRRFEMICAFADAVGDEVGGFCCGGDFVHGFQGFSDGEFVGERDFEIYTGGDDAGFFDVAVRDGDDVSAVDVFYLGGFQADDGDFSVDVIIKNYVADGEIVVGDDGETADNVFQGILGGDTDDGAEETDAGDDGGNVDVVYLENDEESEDDENVAEGGLGQAEIGF